MRILSRSTLREFWLKHPDAEAALKSWYAETERANWTSFHEIKSLHRSASIVGDDRVVFNIKGNTYRLIVRIHFPTQRVFIRFIGTHAQYEKIKADKV
jgi:mRNA interferase HigB